MNTKIGIGIITCNREHFLQKCYNSIPKENVDAFVIVNDGKPLKEKYDCEVIQHTTSKNVGESKNDALRYMLDKNCDYLFTLEDDIFIKEPDIFNKYIEASKTTGIQHFNFGFSQRENLDGNFQPIYRKIVDYGTVKIILTQHILGAFTFYTRKALQTVGLHYYEFNKGHGDHLELTYRAGNVHKLTTPFWWFADLYESWNMIENQSNFTTDSVVRDPNTFRKNFDEARSIFKKLHGKDIYEVPDISEAQLIPILKDIKIKHGLHSK
jgi:glycosyltransferase involved in cell wall biosynthesis